MKDRNDGQDYEAHYFPDTHPEQDPDDDRDDHVEFWVSVEHAKQSRRLILEAATPEQLKEVQP